MSKLSMQSMFDPALVKPAIADSFKNYHHKLSGATQ